ncbi:UNVERIFIED_CONTAM: protein IQ-DOMAIN 14 [Sesamum angustifolium]|uniref:Protein IQ-DOMAIN 14 n=1 Tax=Sesamum angustifolium TaxID=2727405 RepID=A0AAW2RID0_9LAMI
MLFDFLKCCKKDKRKRWIFRLLKVKQLAPFSASMPARERLSWEAAEQNNCDLPVIVAKDAIDVGQVPVNGESAHQQEQCEKSAESHGHADIQRLSHQDEQASQELAATKIQAAFRGYLVSFLQKGSSFLDEYLPGQARKALRALKGVVKLQALIRGWAVRQQAINTLKCLQSIVNIQSEVCSKRCERIKDNSHCQEYKSQDFREKDIKVDLNSQKRWDDSTLTKEEVKTLFLNKREACIKRERVKEYYLSHRRSAETEREKVYGRRRYWLEQWVDAQLAKSDNPGNLNRTSSANARNRDEVGGGLPNLRYLQKQYQAEISDSPAYIPRRSPHHRKQRSIGDDSSFAGSPSIPAYMASTESAKAKARSLSSPRLRPLSFDVCSEITSPYKHKLSPISSINSELTGSSWVGNHINSSQKSPRLKGLAGPIKSTMSTKDLRLRGIYYQNGIGVADDANPMGK